MQTLFQQTHMPSLKYRSALIEPPRVTQIMVTVNEMDEWVACTDTSALGRIIKMPIDLLAQSAALFCPYTYSLYCGSA